MGAFYDVYLPPSVPGYPCTVTPTTSTTITEVSGGDEGRNRNWSQPKRKIELPAAEGRLWDIIADLNDHFLVLDGPSAGFPFRDPFDYASVRLLGPNESQNSVLQRVTPTDQALGTGDGLTRTFQLTKAYSRGSYTKARTIGLPVLSNLMVADNGSLVSSSSYSVSRPGGLVTFTTAPAAGHALTWGGIFDIPVRFETDDALNAIVRAFLVGGFAKINLVETRIC